MWQEEGQELEAREACRNSRCRSNPRAMQEQQQKSRVLVSLPSKDEGPGKEGAASYGAGSSSRVHVSLAI